MGGQNSGAGGPLALGIRIAVRSFRMSSSQLGLLFTKIFLLSLTLLHSAAFGSLGFDSSPPNERHPLGLLSTTRHAIAGSAVVVGGERGLLLGSLHPQMTSLYQIDFLDEVVRLNEIHRALLMVARDLRDYQNLRGADAYELWISRRNLYPFAGTEVLNQTNFDWWKNLVREGKVEVSSRRIQNDFLEFQVLFERLQNLARTGKIQILKLDLNNAGDFAKLLLSIRHSGEDISVIDLSNTWWTSYVGPSTVIKLAEKNISTLNRDTIWLFSYRHGTTIWKYFGFHTKELIRQQLSFVDLASLINTQYGDVLARMPAIEGLNVNLGEWLPPEVDLRDSKFECARILSGQMDFIETKIELGRKTHLNR